MTDSFKTVEELEEALSRPTDAVVETLRKLDGDIVFLGIAGKMGPSLARMAKRASVLAGTRRRILGVSRFSSPQQENELHRHGIETLRCDLLDEERIQKLPDAPNVIYLAGMKFGSTGQESLTWAMNTLLPAMVCRKYKRSRIVAFSTGNVYGLVPAHSGGSVETDRPNPVGEYAMSCLGRERMFEHFSRALNQPVALVRLNYACDLRYGVLVDLAQQSDWVKPVDLAMSWFNTLWQGDANALTLQYLAHVAAPPSVFNLTGPELLNVRETCELLGKLMNKPVMFTGTETSTALLSNAQKTFALCGQPQVTSEQLVRWVADWIQRGGATLNKPTHFESRDGKF